ncbi:MAG: hypothetical protein P8182_02705 [Deltaproteobacteria bacterium]
MFRPSMIAAILMSAVLIGFAASPYTYAGTPAPQAPAWISWLPHGYGGTMYAPNTLCSRKKGLLGFRNAPSHIGCWSQPLWGWDVNGFYRGPNVPEPDPVMCQLPIGLIYPENGPALPRMPRRIRK